jgi:hypothetical protein
MGSLQGISMTCDATLSIGLALTAAGMVVALVFMGLTAFVAVSIVFTKAATMPAEPKGLDLDNPVQRRRREGTASRAMPAQNPDSIERP